MRLRRHPRTRATFSMAALTHLSEQKENIVLSNEQFVKSKINPHIYLQVFTASVKFLTEGEFVEMCFRTLNFSFI